jgi:hypothetical protein
MVLEDDRRPGISSNDVVWIVGLLSDRIDRLEAAHTVLRAQVKALVSTLRLARSHLVQFPDTHSVKVTIDAVLKSSLGEEGNTVG